MIGSSVRRSAVISLVSISACCELIRSVDDQLSPSINGGSPVFATSCSKICRTGVSLSRIWLSAPMALIDTSPTDTKSRTLPFLPSCIARDHSSAICSARSCAAPRSSSPSCGLYVTAKRTLPQRSQFFPIAS